MKDYTILFCAILGGVCGLLDATIFSPISRGLQGRLGLAGDLAILPLMIFLQWRESKS